MNKIAFLGKYTVSIYLVHLVVICYVSKLFFKIDGAIGIFVSLFATWGFSYIYEIMYKKFIPKNEFEKIGKEDII